MKDTPAELETEAADTVGVLQRQTAGVLTKSNET